MQQSFILLTIDDIIALPLLAYDHMLYATLVPFGKAQYFPRVYRLEDIVLAFIH